MKNKFFSVIVNIALCAIIACVCVVGFTGGGGAEEVSANSKHLFYGSQSEKDVSLMFNVYENTENVNKILVILGEHEAKATFFLGGCWADDNIDCVRAIHSAGHEVASHGYFHKDHSKMNYEQNLAEIRPSVKLLNAVLGENIALFAPPSGAFCEATVTAAASLGLKTVMWSRDTIDWRDKDSSVIYNRATKNLHGGEFILMHPTNATTEALPSILKYIKDNGLNAVTVSCNIGED